MTIERIPFGSTGHESSRVLFGAAALAFMRQERADPLLEVLLEHGVNHLDVAASYGEAELRLAPWLRTHRDDFFLATKTDRRSAAGAREQLEQSLERMGVDRVDLIQLHNLVDAAEWERALGPGGALEALIDARSQGLVRFIGVTGHGWNAPARHLASLERFAFDSVLFPYNHTLLAQPGYAAGVATLRATCRERGVAVQTIKSVARRRWTDDSARRFSWYEPLADPDAIRRAVHFVLAEPELFLNSSSDARLLPAILEAAGADVALPDAELLAADAARNQMTPLFVPGQDAI